MRKFLKLVSIAGVALFVAASALLCLVGLAIGTCVYMSMPYNLQGPDSPTGLRVIAHVSDCGIGWGADFYTNVEVRDQADRVVATWKDPDGQFPRGGPESLVESMKWVNESVLEFESCGEPVRLRIQQTQSNNGMPRTTTSPFRNGSVSESKQEYRASMKKTQATP